MHGSEKVAQLFYTWEFGIELHRLIYDKPICIQGGDAYTWMSPGGAWVSTRTASSSHHPLPLHPPPQLALSLVSRPPSSALLGFPDSGDRLEGELQVDTSRSWRTRIEKENRGSSEVQDWLWSWVKDEDEGRYKKMRLMCLANTWRVGRVSWATTRHLEGLNTFLFPI